jgi:predicted cupin superfamily sugar epimerase
MTGDEIIARLGLQPHPEGGHFRETFRAPDAHGAAGRGASTAIFFLLRAGERSHWHRVDADEVWHHYAGASLELSMSDDGSATRHLRLGSDFGLGETPQIVVPRGVWQAARSLGNWTLVGCTVAPGFDFAGFELAPPGWQPGPS